MVAGYLQVPPDGFQDDRFVTVGDFDVSRHPFRIDPRVISLKAGRPDPAEGDRLVGVPDLERAGDVLYPDLCVRRGDGSFLAHVPQIDHSIGILDIDFAAYLLHRNIGMTTLDGAVRL